jgi:hypothetical protein
MAVQNGGAGPRLGAPCTSGVAAQEDGAEASRMRLQIAECVTRSEVM